MSFPPITIPELDPASTIDPANDLILVRQGLNDRKATVAQLNNFDFGTFSTATNAPLANDVFLVGRDVGGGNYQNYKMLATDVAFLAGTQMWFYSQNAPAGWSIVAGQGDRVLAVISNSGTGIYNNAGQHGTWQQDNHTLTELEMPIHTHGVEVHATLSSVSDLKLGSGKNSVSGVQQSLPAGGGIGHNHGNSFRPAACCGRICVKL